MSVQEGVFKGLSLTVSCTLSRIPLSPAFCAWIFVWNNIGCPFRLTPDWTRREMDSNFR